MGKKAKKILLKREKAGLRRLRYIGNKSGIIETLNELPERGFIDADNCQKNS